MTGYFYIRTHESYTFNGISCFKTGICSNFIERDSTYATGEITRGKYVIIYEVKKDDMSVIEKLSHKAFKEYNVRHNAGTEFYIIKIIDFIESFFYKLEMLGYKSRKLSDSDIENAIRKKKRIIIKDDDEKDDDLDKIYDIYKNLKIPRQDQKEIIEKSLIYFKQYDKGLLVLICGIGKTLISLWITQQLSSLRDSERTESEISEISRISVSSIIIGVPNKLLLKQWEESVKVLFQDFSYLTVEGGVDVLKIKNFLEKNKKCIVITTYSSAHKVNSATKDINFVFDMKINDECHHLTTNNMKKANTTKTYIQMLNIPSIKQLSLTATLKQLESGDIDEYGDIISNDNVEYFGEIIDKKCLLWAIDKNILCDYVIQTIITDEEQLEQHLSNFHITEENDKRLFLSAFASLKSIFYGQSHHLLIYSNNKDNSLKLNQYIKLLLDDYFDMPDLYYSNYHSEMKTKDQKEIIDNFEKARRGIIQCVYCLGEGWDFPLLDGVVFSENMSSNIRILQSVLRASRKHKLYPNKISKIILPILSRDDWLEDKDNQDLKKVREVIYQMGLEDETISQKIKAYRMNIDINRISKSPKEADEKKDDEYEYDEELTQKIRLKTIKRVHLSITYEKARKIIADKKIKSKESYNELCERDNRLTKEPEVVFKGRFTNWIEYLSIERVYYDLETCKHKVNEYLLLYPEIRKYYLDLSIITKELSKIDNLFPPNELWTEYYNVKDLTDIINITNISNTKKKIGAIL